MDLSPERAAGPFHALLLMLGLISVADPGSEV